MSITTYSGLLTELNRLIDGDEVSVTDVPIATLTQIISLGERRVYREVRHRLNEKAFSGTVTSNLFAIPTDFEATSVIHFGKKALEPVSEEWLLEYLNTQPTGDCRYFAEVGTSFKFGPAVADATTVQGRYFYRLADMTNDATVAANALFLAENSVFLYAMLAESAPFFGQDARLPMWEAKYQSIRDQVNAQKRAAAYSAGRMRVRPSTQLMR